MQKELAEFENHKVTYNGEKMTAKRELAGYDAGINATDNESLKESLQALLTASRFC